MASGEELYCLDCKVVISSLADVVAHKEHNITELKNVTQQIADTIQETLLPAVENQLETFASKMEVLADVKGVSENELTGLEEQMENTIANAHKLVDQEAEKIRADLKEIQELVKHDIQDPLQKAQERNKGMTTLRDMAVKLLAGEEGHSELVQRFPELQAMLASLKMKNTGTLDCTWMNNVSLVPADKNITADKLFGTITFSKVEVDTPKYEACGEFKSSKMLIHGINKTTDGRLWLSSTTFLLAFEYDGETCRWNEVQEVKIPNTWGTMAYDNTIIYAGYKDGGLYQVDSEGNTSTICEPGTFKSPMGVSDGQDGTIMVVSMAEKIIYWCDLKGNISNELSLDAKVFGQPNYALAVSADELMVTDHGKNQVVTINKAGDVITKYIGQESGEGLSNPRSLSRDIYGNILLVERNKNRVHQLDADGTFQQVVMTKEDHGLQYPRCVFIDDKDLLYVGQESNIIKVFKYPRFGKNLEVQAKLRQYDI